MTFNPKIYIRDYVAVDNPLLTGHGIFTVTPVTVSIGRQLLLQMEGRVGDAESILLSGDAQTSSPQIDLIALSGDQTDGDDRIIIGGGGFRVGAPNVDLQTAAGATYDLDVTVGAFTLTGIDVTTLRDLILTLSTGTFSLSGTTTDLDTMRYLGVTVGTFTETGNSIDMLRDLQLDVTAGTFSLSGTTTDLDTTRYLGVTVGTFTETGVAVELDYHRHLDVTKGTFTLTGNSVTLTPSGLTFGDHKGSDTANTDAVGDTGLTVGSGVSVAVGDIIVVCYAERVSDSSTGISDGLGNTFNDLAGGSQDFGAVAGRAWYSVVTNAGTSTVAVTTSGGSTHDAALSMSVYEGGFGGLSGTSTWIEDLVTAYNTNTVTLNESPPDAQQLLWAVNFHQPSETDWNFAADGGYTFTQRVNVSTQTAGTAQGVTINAGELVFDGDGPDANGVRAAWTGTSPSSSGLLVVAFSP